MVWWCTRAILVWCRCVNLLVLLPAFAQVPGSPAEAVAAGMGCGFAVDLVVLTVLWPLVTGARTMALVSSLSYTMAAVVAVLVFVVLAYLAGARDAETRCRKCGYILRGITEPTCSECGERI